MEKLGIANTTLSSGTNGVVVEEPGTSTATMPSVLMYGDAFEPLSDWESDPEFEADEPEEEIQPTDAEVSD